jgi:hypothetical protein
MLVAVPTLAMFLLALLSTRGFERSENQSGRPPIADAAQGGVSAAATDPPVSNGSMSGYTRGSALGSTTPADLSGQTVAPRGADRVDTDLVDEDESSPTTVTVPTSAPASPPAPSIPSEPLPASTTPAPATASERPLVSTVLAPTTTSERPPASTTPASTMPAPSTLPTTTVVPTTTVAPTTTSPGDADDREATDRSPPGWARKAAEEATVDDDRMPSDWLPPGQARKAERR